MKYIWKHPQKIKHSEIANFDFSDWTRCDQIKVSSSFEGKDLELKFPLSKGELLLWDVLPNNSQLPILKNERIGECEEYLKGVSTIPVKIDCKDGVIDSFSILNIKNRLSIIDFKQSTAKKVSGFITGFTKLFLQSLDNTSSQLARDVDFPDYIFVGDDFYEHILEKKWRGVWLSTTNETNL